MEGEFRQSLLRLVKDFPGRGIEVGVHRGATSQLLLRALPKLHLTLVDAWGDHPQYPDQGKYLEEVKKRVAPMEGRFTILQRLSVDAAHAIGPTPIADWIFIDADHSYESVRDDLAAWYPLLKVDGLFCGHDYGKSDYPGVTQAVDEWAAREGKTIRTAAGSIWWTVKTQAL